MKETKCGNCLYFDKIPTEPEQGLCFYNPPVPYPVQNKTFAGQVGTMSLYPVVHCGSYCSKFREVFVAVN